MISNWKRLVFAISILIICVQIYQKLYWDDVVEIAQADERDQSEQFTDETQVVAGKSKLDTVVNEIWEQIFSNDKQINEVQNRNTESSSTSTSTTTASATTTSSVTVLSKNDQPEGTNITQKLSTSSQFGKEFVTDEVQAKIAEAIRHWRTVPAKREKFENPAKYDGRNLLNDPVFKFDSNFKNPCWFENDQFQCLPYVYLIGVKKSGTGDLFYRMSLHPDFIRPGFKEAQWFARKRFWPGGIYDDIYEYVSMFHKAAEKILYHSNNSSDGRVYNYEDVTGEGSPSNLHRNDHWKHLPGNENLDEPKYVFLDYIHHFIPQAKILIIFRDPVDRLYSEYYHDYGIFTRRNKPNPRQFHSVVSAGVKLYQDCFKRRSVRSCVYEPFLYEQIKIHIQLGIYYIFWQDLTRIFPREQILVIQNKKFHDKGTTMRRVYQFLNLRDLTSKEMEKVANTKETSTRREVFKKQGPMLNETRKILQEFYRPFNKLMSEITGDSDFLYTNADDGN